MDLSLLKEGLTFSFLDYSLFGLMLGLSTIIGIYFGFCAKKKQDNTMEYLLGSKQMKVFPVAVSLTATHISAVTILGVPAEMYQFGTQYWASAISGLVVTLAMAYFYLPVFYELQTTTIYAYLERRFDRRMCQIASGIFCFASIIYLPLIIYAPAIAFSQVTGINLHMITPIMTVICIFYTSFGGIRAVVWTDTIQFISMVGGLILVMVLGTYVVGGVGSLYEIAERGERLIWFNMDPNPEVRSSFWSVTIGLTSMWISLIGVSPECIQRFLSVPTYKDSQKIVWLFGFGHTAVKLFTVFCGVIIYARYEKCDPVIIGEVKRVDQILAYYVMDITKNIPGLPGLFVAGVFSAALSSMSSSLNVISGAIYGDFLKPWFPNASEKTASSIMKAIVIGIGALSLALVFVVEQLGSIFSLAISIVGVTAGPLLGIFTLGMAFPKANRHGAFWGSLVSLVFVTFISAGAQIAISNKQLRYESLPFRTDGCEAMGYTNYMNSSKFVGNPNSTVHILNKDFDNSEVYWLFRLGYMYYSLLGTLIVFIVGYPVSLLTGGCPGLDERLLAPLPRRLYVRGLKKQKQKEAELSQINLKPLNNDKPKDDNTTDDDNHPNTKELLESNEKCA